MLCPSAVRRLALQALASHGPMLQALSGGKIQRSASGLRIEKIQSQTLETPRHTAGLIRVHLRTGRKMAVPEGETKWSLENVMVDLATIADATTPDAPFVATGHSFGGLASLHFAARHPERVAALVLVGAGPGFKKPEALEGWAQQVERTATFLETRGFEDFVNGRAGTTCIGSKPELPAAQAAAKAIIAQSVPGVARFGREISAAIPSVIDELAGIDAPALVLVGENDKPYLRAGEVMSAKLARARHVVVPQAGHIVNIEQPEIFEREVLAFLAELEAG